MSVVAYNLINSEPVESLYIIDTVLTVMDLVFAGTTEELVVNEDEDFHFKLTLTGGFYQTYNIEVVSDKGVTSAYIPSTPQDMSSELSVSIDTAVTRYIHKNFSLNQCRILT